MASREVLESQGMPQLHQLDTIVGDYINSGISIHYVSGWALKEALRELIQNAVDGMVSFMKNTDSNAKKSDWKILMHEHRHAGIYRTFTFVWPSKQNAIIGKIIYDADNQEVILQNPGTINKFNLLLGGSGSSKQQNDPDIIGRFGEGMKLAALALLRPTQKPYANYLRNHSRSLTIDTGGQRWLFKLDTDRNFDGEICLFYKIRDLTNREGRMVKDQWTYTRIQGVTLDEWNQSYKNFIFFCKPEEIMEIPTISNVTHKGSLLLEDSMKGRFFVKDLHIHDYKSYEYDSKDDEKTYQSFKNGDPTSSFYGYNSNQVELNRDRKAIPNLWHKYDRSSCILADVLNNMQQNLNIHRDARDLLNEMWPVVYWSLKMGRYEVYYLVGYVKNNKATCDRIWQQWVKDKQYFPNNENYDRKIMPMYTSHQVQIERFFASNHLEASFYKYKVLSNLLCGVLYNSNCYERWNVRFDTLMDTCDDSKLNDEENVIKERLIQRMSRIKNDFNGNMIRFKDPPLQKATSCLKGGKLYLAKELLRDENQLLLKCLQLLKIPSSRLLEFCNV